MLITYYCPHCAIYTNVSNICISCKTEMKKAPMEVFTESWTKAIKRGNEYASSKTNQRR